MGSVTVVLPTFRRPEGLARVLRSLANQQNPGVEWDLLVVDNDEGAEASAVFEMSRHRLPVAAALVHEPARGATRARNAGIERATGDVIAFVDDDVVPADALPPGDVVLQLDVVGQRDGEQAVAH